MWQSTTTTTMHSTKYKDTFSYKKEKVGLVFQGNIFNFSEVKKFHKDEPGLVDLISDQPKVFIGMTTSLFHLYHDMIGSFLTQYELNPKALYIIDVTTIADIEPLPEYIKMFFKFLNQNKVDYRAINFQKVNKININNFYYKNFNAESDEINNPSPKIYEFSQRYIKDKTVEANKKIFLSRKNFQQKDLSFLIKGRLPYENDDRIDNEELLKEYFESLGFETIVPEDFETFEEQMNYFYQARMICSTTSSGFINACFMRPGSTMIELSTPLISFNSIGNGVTSPLADGQEEIHHFYHMMSIAMNHKYISIPNKNRSAKEIIDVIENDIYLKRVLES